MLSNLGISLTTAGFLLTACPLISAEPTDVQTAPVYLYGVEFTRPSFELKIAKETYEVIQKSIEPRKLIVRNVTTSGLDEAIKERKADIVIANSGIYRRYLQNGWRDVLTLATGVQPNPDLAVGSLILANKNLGVKTIEDLKGHSIALNTPSAFQGTLTIKKELLDRRYDPDSFFSKILYLGTNPQKRLEAVRNGEADSTFLSVCYAGRHKRKTGIDLTEGLDVVGVKPNLSSHCLTSTDLYPNFSLLVSSNLSSQMIRQIAENLLRIKPNADGEYWTFASDYDPVDKMYEALKEGPYQHLKSWTLTRIWNEFKTLILLLILSLLFAIWHIYATGKAVYKATNDILKATQDQKKKAEEIQSIKNALVVSSLSSVIAHEVGQPLAACLFYANSLDKLLKNWTAAKKAMALEAAEALQQQLTRVTDILSIVQNYAAKRKSKKEFIYLNDSINKIVANFVRSQPASEKLFRLNLCKNELKVSFPQLEFEIAISNLIRNSYQALKDKSDPEIRISTNNSRSSGFEICITDNSGKFTEEVRSQLERPLASKKEEGTGLGISIVKSILRRHGFGVKFQRSDDHNLVCIITVFPNENSPTSGGKNE